MKKQFTKKHVRIGYEKGRFVTGMTQQAEPDLNEEPVGVDEVVPDAEEMSLVATSAEVCTMYIFHHK